MSQGERHKKQAAQCYICANQTKDLIYHLRNVHTTRRYVNAELAPFGYIACECGWVCSSVGGRTSHQKSSIHTSRMAEQANEAGPVPPASSQGIPPPPTTTPPATQPPPPASTPPATPPAPSGPSLLDQYETLISLPGQYEPLSPHQYPIFRSTTERLAKAYNDDPTDVNMFNILCLPKIGVKPDSGPKRMRSFIQRLQQFPNVVWPVPKERELQRERENVARQTMKAIEKGKISTAGRIFSEESKLAPATAETAAKLQALHPAGSDNPFGNSAGPQCRLKVTETAALKVFRKLAPDTAPGISGWTMDLLTIVAVEGSEFSKFMVNITQQLAGGQIPGEELLGARRAAALVKGLGVRPLVIDDLLLRWSTKILLQLGQTSDMLLPTQLGVGTPGGVEPLIRFAERAIEGTLPDEYDHILRLDMSNAFNRLDLAHLARAIAKHAPNFYRISKLLYNKPRRLLYPLETGEVVKIEVSQGLNQGGVLNSLLFSIGFRPVLEELQKLLGPDCKVPTYIDDTDVYSKGSVKAVVYEFFDQEAIKKRGIFLNVAKSEETMLHSGTELDMLGSYVGPRPEAWLEAKVAQQIDQLNRLDTITAQHSLLLLRLSLQQKLRHLMRSLPPTPEVLLVWKKWDGHLQQAVLRLRGQSTTAEPLDARLLSFPLRFGGSGILSHEECARHARAAMVEKADSIIQQFAPALDYDPPEEFKSQRDRCREMHLENRAVFLHTLSTVQRKMFVDNHSHLGSQWLSAIPYNSRSSLSNAEISAGLHIRTLTNGHNIVCRCCNLPNHLGHDEVCMQRQNFRTQRHEYVKKAIGYAVKQIKDTEVLIEPFLVGRLDKTDLRISGPGSFRQTQSDYDVTLISIFAGNFPQVPVSEEEDLFEETQAMLEHFLANKAAEKNRHYCGLTPSAFHPVVFSTGGTMGKQTKEIFDHWRTCMDDISWRNFILSVSTSILRSRSRSFLL